MMKPKNNYTNLAWEFLRRSPEYQTGWNKETHSLPRSQIKDNSLRIPLFTQSHSDLLAEKWGLHSFQNPSIPSCEMSPFWNGAPVMEVEVISNSQRPLLPLLRKLGISISGLFLINGSLILKIENHLTSIQVLVKNGHMFNESSSLALRVIFDDQFSHRISSSLSFWNHATFELAKKMALTLHRTTMNFFSFSIFFRPEALIAR